MNLEKRLDKAEIELQGLNNGHEPEPEPLTPAELRDWFAFEVYKDSLRNIQNYFECWQKAQPGCSIGAYLMHLRFPEYPDRFPEPEIPDDIGLEVNQIGWEAGYSFLKSTAILNDDLGLHTRAGDLLVMDVPDLTRCDYVYASLGESPQCVRLPWRDVLAWLTEHDFGTWGSPEPWPDSGLGKLVNNEEYSWRRRVLGWLDQFGEDIVTEIYPIEVITKIQTLQETRS